jgi:hypothetical protein
MWKANHCLKVTIQKYSVDFLHFVLLVCSHSCDVCTSAL